MPGRLTYANVTATAALFVALGGGAIAATSFVGRDGTISACVNARSGTPRLVSSGRKCRRVERKVIWNQRGRKGDTGERGLPGPATGPAGGDLTGDYPNPVIANGAVVGAKLGDAAVSGGKLAAGIPHDIEYVQNSSLINSTDKSGQVECPAGKLPIGGGAAAPTSGANGFVALTVSRPQRVNAGPPPNINGWFAQAIEVNGGSTQSWGIDLYVICARF